MKPHAVKLERCPICQYSLQGLPVPHRCPECGFHYDERTRVWSWRPSRLAWLGMSGYAAGGLTVLLAGVTVAIPFWIVGGVYMLWQMWAMFKRGRFAAVGPEGIAFRMDTPVVRRVDWADVEALRPQRYDRLCRIHTRDAMMTYLVGGVFNSKDEVMEFVTLSESYMNARAEIRAGGS